MMGQKGRQIGLGVAAAVALVGLALLPAQVGAAPGFKLTRLEGATRYDTAQVIAADAFKAGADNAVIVLGTNFPDALAGGFLAGGANAPILLVETNAVPKATRDALGSLKTKKVFLLGGTGAIGQKVEDDLKNTNSSAQGGGALSVERIAGATRYATAKAVATSADRNAIGTVDNKRTAIVASGATFPDALAAGPIAYRRQFPILLTTPERLSPEAKAGLTELGIQQVLVLGGTAAVSAAAETEIKATNGITVIRLAGANRSETATKVAAYARQSLAFASDKVNLANGANFPDALAGAPAGGVAGTALLLSQSPTALGAAAQGYLRGQAPTLQSGKVLGGTGALSKEVQDAAEAAGRGLGESTRTLTVTPATLDESPRSTAQGTNNEGRHAYTVNVPASIASVNVDLVPASAVLLSGTIATFISAGLDATPGVSIENLNGTSVGTAGAGDVKQVKDVSPVNGSITIIVDSQAVAEIVPVIYEDALDMAADRLDVDAEGVPLEQFGIGGVERWVPAPSGNLDTQTEGLVTFVDKQAGVFGLDTGTTITNTPNSFDFALTDVTFRYDSGDSFEVALTTATVPATATMTSFVAELSRGDGVRVSRYRLVPEELSSYALVSNGPAAPTVTATQVDQAKSSNDVLIKVTPSRPSSPLQYQSFVVQRALVSSGNDGARDGTVGEYTTIRTITITIATVSGLDIIITDENLSATPVVGSVYRYRALGQIDGDPGAFGESTNRKVTMPLPLP